jgi:ferredoxin-NADP reductase
MKRNGAILIATLLLAGCGSTSSLGTSADQLDSATHRYYRQVYQSRAPSHVTSDASALAEASRSFNRAVDRNRSRDELQPSFDRVAERYHHLRTQLEKRDTDYVGSGPAFEHVTEAYLDVDRAMNHAGSGDHR